MRIAFVVDDTDQSNWHTIMNARTRAMVEALEQMGTTLLLIPISELRNAPDDALAQIEAFRPDALTASSINFLLVGSAHAERLLHLDVPTFAMWDDPLGAMFVYSTFQMARWNQPALVNAPPETSRGLALAFREWYSRLRGRRTSLADDIAPEFLRRHVGNPRLIHLAWDSGHADAFVSLGLGRREQIHWYPVPTYEAFLSTGDQAAEIPQTTDVAFCGNLYLDQTRRDPCFREPALESVVAGMVRRKLADLGRSNWDLLCEELDRLSPRTRDRLGLYPGRRAFWEFYIAAIWTAMNTHPRMEILKRIPRRVRMFGLFSEHASRELLQEYPNLEFAGQLDQFRELPMQFAATRVNICLSNGLIQRGTPSKLIDCLASGGFALCDPKADLMRLFGPKVKAIFCRNSDEFNAKIDYFLSKPKERREIVEALRRDIRKHCTLRAFYERALGLVREQRRAWSSKARSAA